MDGLIKRSPVEDAVYAFMDKKQAQGKPYYVYMYTSLTNGNVCLLFFAIYSCIAFTLDLNSCLSLICGISCSSYD